MRMRLIVALVAVLPLIFAEPLAARTIFPPIGWLTGSSWDEHCPQDKFLVGFRVRNNGAIYSMRIVCVSMTATGARRGALWYGPDHGGSAGEVQEFSCPHDSVIMGLRVDTNPRTEKTFTNPRTVTALCVSRANRARTQFAVGQNLSPAGPAKPDNAFHQLCPAGETGSGINGLSNNTLVYAVGFDCAIRLAS